MSAKPNIESVLRKFERIRPKYARFTKYLESELKRKISQSGIPDFVIKSRTKDRDSFLEKITRPGKDYKDPVHDITDLSGLRVVVYYKSEIKKLESLIENEFIVDPEKSRDASESLAENAFGYLSIHKIVTIKENNNQNKQKHQFQGLFAEIQLRTCLQDAWATISHDSQYKVESLIPFSLRRRISILAGLFELSDQEFMYIKQESEKIKKDYFKKEKRGDRDIPIDLASLTQFFHSSALMTGMISFARSLETFEIDTNLLEHYNEADSFLVGVECERLGIKTIEELEKQLASIRSIYQEFLIKLSRDRIWRATSSFVLFLLLIKANPSQYTSEYLHETYGWDYGFCVSIINSLKESV